MEPEEDIHEPLSEDPVPPRRAHHCTFTITLRGFSSCSENEEAVLSTQFDSEVGDDTFKNYYEVKLCPNGSAGNEGYVSILFVSNTLLLGYLSTQFSCVASVVDASGEKRFPQTFTYVSEPSHSGISHSILTTGFERYIERSALRSDASSLLPDDSLTVCLEIDYHIRRRYSNSASETTIIRPNGERFRYFIPADAPFGREVCRWSSVFRRMRASPMLEGQLGHLYILHEEIEAFEFFSHVVRGSDFIARGVSPIRDLYVIADKYVMPRVLHACRQLLLSILRATDCPEVLRFVDKDMHVVSELAEVIKDDRLEEIVSIYSRIKCELEGGALDLEASIANKLKTEWICKYERNFLDGSFFKFSKFRNEYLGMDIYK